MPYIKQKRRELLDDNLKKLSTDIESPGDLNYCFTILAINYIKKFGVNYSKFNDCIGVFECAKLEFYRKSIVPYEEEKIKENGDITIK